jgi:probable F420-dependent oxidoreductase
MFLIKKQRKILFDHFYTNLYKPLREWMVMKFGIAIPTCAEGLVYKSPFITPEGLIQLSVKAEELGYDSIWANDHITTPNYVKKLSKVSPNFFEPLISLSIISCSTKKIKLATGVIVLPQRNPVILAKQVSTLDVFSNGRVILGVGLGAYREEFEAVNPSSSYQSRSLILEEGIRAIKILLSQKRASFNGQFFKFRNVEMYPKPVQSKLPIYIGGNSDQAIRRTAELGDGWFPAILTPSELSKKINLLREFVSKAKRRIDEIEIAPQFIVSISKDRKKALKIFRNSRAYSHLTSLKVSTLREQALGTLEERNLVGNPSDIIKKIENYIDVGVTYFAALVFIGESIGDIIKNMSYFARDVMECFL